MSWLTRIELDVTAAGRARIFDSYDWHQKIWECFPNRINDQRDFLTRVDQLDAAFRVWVLSACAPTRPAWCPAGCFASKEISQNFLGHRFYAFDLVANPTRAICQPKESDLPGRRGRSKRVAINGDAELKNWLEGKGLARRRDELTGVDIPGGFRLAQDRPLEIQRQGGQPFKKRGKKGGHQSVRFRGILEVTDPMRFVETYHQGIGSAKGFGFGMLLLAPATI